MRRGGDVSLKNEGGGEFGGAEWGGGGDWRGDGEVDWVFIGRGGIGGGFGVANWTLLDPFGVARDRIGEGCSTGGSGGGGLYVFGVSWDIGPDGVGEWTSTGIDFGEAGGLETEDCWRRDWTGVILYSSISSQFISSEIFCPASASEFKIFCSFCPVGERERDLYN